MGSKLDFPSMCASNEVGAIYLFSLSVVFPLTLDLSFSSYAELESETLLAAVIHHFSYNVRDFGLSLLSLRYHQESVKQMFKGHTEKD